MPDVFTKAKRSEVMARIRARGNKDTELALAKLRRRHPISGWRRQIQIITSPRRSPQKNVHSPRPSPGLRPPAPAPASEGKRGEGVRVRPDFVFPKLRLAVFVDGCFWHGCPLHATKPRNHAPFWRRKLAANRVRDRLVTRTLRSANWRVLRLWEHELPRKREARLLRRIRRALA